MEVERYFIFIYFSPSGVSSVKGMRIVERPEDFELMLESSIREAVKSFGDDKVLVEKYLVKPRSIFLLCL